jgi:hypothetical protein
MLGVDCRQHQKDTPIYRGCQADFGSIFCSFGVAAMFGIVVTKLHAMLWV